jgi:hypothetical protein
MYIDVHNSAVHRKFILRQSLRNTETAAGELTNSMCIMRIGCLLKAYIGTVLLYT